MPPAAPPGAPPARPAIERMKWTAADFADAGEGRLPIGKAVEEWSVGDLDAGFAAAALVLDETFVVPSTGHHPMETRSAMAYWQNGRLYLHCSTQSVVRTVDGVARWVGIEPSQVVLISEYTGGGFGSKGGGSVTMAIPALLSKKAGAPVMMRVSREEESYFGRARTSMVGRAKMGFAKDGRITALDLFIVQDGGPYGPMGDHRSAGLAASLVYQPAAMRWRAVNVLTNTPPRSQQRSPGPMQANGIVEPVVTKAARQLGLDQVAIRRLNSPEGKARFGPAAANGQRRYVTGAFVKQALDRGAELFDWQTRVARSGQRRGTKVRGVGVTVGPHGSGSSGLRRPDDAPARRETLRAIRSRKSGDALVDRSDSRRQQRRADRRGRAVSHRRHRGVWPSRSRPPACFASGARRRRDAYVGAGSDDGPFQRSAARRSSKRSIASGILLVVMVGPAVDGRARDGLHGESRPSRGAHHRVRAGQDGAVAGAGLQRFDQQHGRLSGGNRAAAPAWRSAAARTRRRRSNGYVDWLAYDGSLLGGGTTAPATWFYERVWQITSALDTA